MNMEQTGRVSKSPTGTWKNCNSWAEYETPGSSETAKMCNGGWFQGDNYDPCESINTCRSATIAKQNSERRHLPVYQSTNPERPFFGSRTIAATPNLSDGLQGWPRFGQLPTTMPKASVQTSMGRPTVPMPSPMQVGVQLPYPVKPPAEWPSAMHTAYAGPVPVQHGGVTPTFLPQEGEGVFERLGKNVAQGLVGSTGWHIFDFARTVDLFRRK
jgi:hypothetical protein